MKRYSLTARNSQTDCIFARSLHLFVTGHFLRSLDRLLRTYLIVNWNCTAAIRRIFPRLLPG